MCVWNLWNVELKKSQPQSFNECQVGGMEMLIQTTNRFKLRNQRSTDQLVQKIWEPWEVNIS